MGQAKAYHLIEQHYAKWYGAGNSDDVVITVLVDASSFEGVKMKRRLSSELVYGALVLGPPIPPSCDLS